MRTNYIFITLGLSILIRVSIFISIYPDTEIISHSDQIKYIKMAEYITQNWNFDSRLGSGRMPLYPIFLALCRLLSNDLFFALIVQNLFGLTSIYFIYKMGLLLSERAAMVAGVLASLNLNFAVNSNTLLTESIFYPIFCIFLLKMFQYVKNGKSKDVLVSGILLGLCTLIRPVTMYLPILIGIFILMQFRKHAIKRMYHSFIFVLFFLLIIAPWLYRNYTVFGYYNLTTQGEAHIIGWIIPSIMQNEDKIDMTKAIAKSSQIWKQKKKMIPEEVRNDPFALDREAKKYLLNYLFSCSPMSIIKAWFWGAMKNVFSPISIELAYMLKMDWTHFYETPGKGFVEQAWNFLIGNKNKLYCIMMISGILGILIFRIVQLYGGWRLFYVDRDMFILCCTVILYFIIISGPVGYGKYRLPFEPILILFTVIPLSDLFERKRRFLRQGADTV